MAGIAGLSAGLDWIEGKGVENIHSHEVGWIGMLQDGPSEIDGITIWGTKRLDQRVATMSISVANYDASDIGSYLDVDYNILTRTGLHCAPLLHEFHGSAPRGTVRFSAGPFNTEEHVVAAVKAVAEITSHRPAAGVASASAIERDGC